MILLSAEKLLNNSTFRLQVGINNLIPNLFLQMDCYLCQRLVITENLWVLENLITTTGHKDVWVSLMNPFRNSSSRIQFYSLVMIHMFRKSFRVIANLYWVLMIIHHGIYFNCHKSIGTKCAIIHITSNHYFNKILRTWVFFVGPLIPLFWTSGDVSSGFQSQSGQPYSCLAEVYVLYVPLDSLDLPHSSVTC